MKKIFFLLIAANGALSAFAQAPGSNNNMDNSKPRVWFKPDSMLTRWVVDVNATGGFLTRNMTVANTSGNYTNGINNNTGSLKFSNGLSAGGDAEVGYFFGKKAHFGIGTGIQYLYQQGDAYMNGFNVQYESTDNNGNIFRQLITADNQIKEHVTVSNINIPLLLKYKKRFTQRVGFTADAGILYNLQEKNSYNTNATFDYQAIYDYTTPPPLNGLPTVYDNNVTPLPTDYLITKANYRGDNVNQYFASQAAAGYNVGLGVQPSNKTGSVSYLQGSVGLLLRPAVNVFLSDNCALNFGLYYQYQPFNHNLPSGYMLTDKVGSYSSVLNTVTASKDQSYGLNVGVRFFFGKQKDSDHDGVPDRKDWCPYVWGLPQFHGCPDTDGDGIPDYEDSCVDVPGTAQFHGCPDSDGDGIPDKDDRCPYQAGPIQFHGCPDSDGDGIPDIDDRCPFVPGPASNQGCPYDTVKPTPPPVKHEPEVDLNTPILFETGKANIHESSYDVLEEAVLELNDNPDAVIIIDGNTDDVGSPSSNRILSQKRAASVKQYLTEMGINPKRLLTVGHGEEMPVAPNTTAEGRAKNRRAIMTLKHHHETE
jgi:outer membrane protein OmpA-like peptidoglycan-associated protein